MALYFCLKTNSSRSVVWHPREIPERSCFRVASRKRGMYRYSYRIHGRCFRYKGLFPSSLPPPSLVARRTTVSNLGILVLSALLRPVAPVYPERGESPHQKVLRRSATRISGAVSVHTFITKFAENCWKRMKGEKAGKRKNWSAGKTRIGEEKEKSRYLGDIGWSIPFFFLSYVLFAD